MKGQTLKSTRIVLLVFSILWAIYGLLHVISPELMQAVDPPIERVLGAAVFTFALGAALAYFDKTWARVRNLVLVEIIWMSLYTLTMAWGILIGAITPDAWTPTIIGAVSAILLLFLYLREEKLQKA